jgi:hypothetical protein
MEIPQDIVEQILAQTGVGVEVEMTAQHEVGVFSSSYSEIQSIIDAVEAICNAQFDTMIREPGDGCYMFFGPRHERSAP